MDYSQKAKRYLYYIIIGLVSIIFTCFLPMVGSEGQIVSHFPTSGIGWIVWIITKLSTAVLNMVIFYCFMEQAVLNVKDDPKYIEAKSILDKCQSAKKKNPRSPKLWKKQEYSKKGTIVFVSTAFALVGLENMILSWKLETFLSYIFTIFLGVIFGILQMKKAEIYWTEEYNDYAKYVYEKEYEADEKARIEGGYENARDKENLS